jgi:hypothetical protein
MSATEALGISIPKPPALDNEDIKVGPCFPAGQAARMAALLSLALLILGFAVPVAREAWLLQWAILDSSSRMRPALDGAASA